MCPGRWRPSKADRDRSHVSLPDLRAARALGNWREWWPDDAAATLDDVRARLAAAVEVWELRDLRLFGSGEVAVVLSARSRERDVVVKLNPRPRDDADEFTGEAAGLAFWAPTGAVVPPLDGRDDGATMLLARLRPGVALRDARLGESAILEQLGLLAARLHAAGRPPDGEFLRLADSSLGRDLAVALEGQSEGDELDELLRPGQQDVLIHADLHSLNALQADGAFKAIDPKPHLADPNADIFQLVLDPFLELPEGHRDSRALAAERLKRYVQAAGLDPDRARAWTRVIARGIEEQLRRKAPPSDWDLHWADRMRRLAAALN